MNRYLLLTLTTLPVLAAFGCKKTVPTVEAGADMDAAVAVADDAAAPVAEADAGPAPTLAVTNKPVPVAPKDAGPPPPGPFQGTYTCFAGMTLTQTGNSVSGRLKPGDPQNYSTVACNVSGDSCEGATTIYTAGKPTGTKKSSMKRDAKGDITYKADGEPSTACHKK